jgi:hypothetical protein
MLTPILRISPYLQHNPGLKFIFDPGAAMRMEMLAREESLYYAWKMRFKAILCSWMIAKFEFEKAEQTGKIMATVFLAQGGDCIFCIESDLPDPGLALNNLNDLDDDSLDPFEP